MKTPTKEDTIRPLSIFRRENNELGLRCCSICDCSVPVVPMQVVYDLLDTNIVLHILVTAVYTLFESNDEELLRLLSEVGLSEN